jgi:glycosyltransferase involved in cell wall biosynthesis
VSTDNNHLKFPLVSVIIPCYNHSKYLTEAFESVFTQPYPAKEIIVVDDGSKDDTAEVCRRFPEVKYVYQHNQGLSAARNTGIKNCYGEYLVFLDADDWLLEDAIAINAKYLLNNSELAFVSGAHKKVFVDKGSEILESEIITGNHYWHFLQGNYIGMHATVMYRKSIFDRYSYDTSLKACEDYDLYLNISRSNPVLHHTKQIAAYRLHSSNMSGNIELMLSSVLKVLNRQKPFLKDDSERKALTNGNKIWKKYYQSVTVKQKNSKPISSSSATKSTTMINALVKKYAPASFLRWLYKKGLYKSYRPQVGKVEPGDFGRKNPLSIEFGYDRGGPVDRYYIENFLQKESKNIKGRVMEIGDNEYTLKYGGNAVTQSDILHVDATNSKATFVGDLTHAPQVPDNTFDCVVLTQTLHLIYDFKAALATCHRILKPGGVLLMTNPYITPIDHGEWKETWYWAFTDKVIKKLCEEMFPGAKVDVETFGNVYVASAFLYGMGISEVTKKMMDHRDQQFQVITTAKVQKKSA